MDDLQNYFQTLLNDNTNPCIVIDIKTSAVVFVNIAMDKLLREADSFHDDLQKRCFDVLYDNDKTKVSGSINRLQSAHFIETYTYNKSIKRHYRVNETAIELEGKTFILSKYFLTSSFMNKQISFEDAIAQTVEIFAKNDMETMANEFLMLLGNFYQSDKSFVFYLDDDRTKIINKYKWTKDRRIVISNQPSDKVAIETILKWISHKDENNMVEANVLLPNSPNFELDKIILSEFHLSNIIICVIEDNKGSVLGGVGISNRTALEFDNRLLKTVSHFIKDGFSRLGVQKELKTIAETDFITGFNSRVKYVKTLDSFENAPPKKIGVVFVNINGLRRTNEFLGFSKGDEKIVKSAKVIREFFDEDFYRISGDEFVGFCIGDDEDDFMCKITRLRDRLKEDENPIFSVGHAWRIGNDINVTKLINEADIVMYINKQDYYYASESTSEEVSDSTLKNLLRYIANEEFLVYLQPQIDLKTENLIGAEALIRRFDKENSKMVFPDQFIPLYEKKSVIRHVDIFVVNQVCKLLNEWKKLSKAVPISVNLSRVTLMEYDIVNTIAKICDAHEVPRNLLVVEVTERIGLIENDVATTLIDDFKANGFRVSLDDFGCAYSNIVTLANVSVDEVKIDKSLVDNLLENEKNQVIVRSMIDMCNNFSNTNTLAEGIETREQADILRDFNCTYGQGYLYSRPIPNEEFFEKYIKD